MNAVSNDMNAQKFLSSIPDYSNDGSQFLITRSNPTRFSYCSEAEYWKTHSVDEVKEGVDYLPAEEATIAKMFALTC